MNVLLVEPDYYTRYPPLGLLKLSTYHKSLGDAVEFVRGNIEVGIRPDKIYVTSLFTWDWRAVWQSVRHYKAAFPDAEVILGGIYASLIPSHAALSGADTVWEGLHPFADKLQPDYSLVPDWGSSVLFATRGCPRKCGFCSVPKLEGPPVISNSDIRSQIHPGHRKVIFFDNNILGTPNCEDVFEELIELGVSVDFNQGMDARYIDEGKAKLIAKMKTPIIRLAFDYAGIRPWVEKAIGLLKDQGVPGRKIVFYTLYNYIDDSENFYNRVRDLFNWGAVVYPMRYEPLCTLEKAKYIAPGWSSSELNMVQSARRVIGFGGAFPPYEGLVKKFNDASGFLEAFALRPVGGRVNIPQGIREMALEHEQPIVRTPKLVRTGA